MTEIISPIPSRLKNVAVGGHVAGADQIIDDQLNKDQETINAEVAEALGDVAFIDDSESSPAVVPGFDPTTDTVHVTAQTLSEQQKAQVRTNIGLGDVDAKINQAVASEASRAQSAEQNINSNVNSRLNTQDQKIALLNGNEVIVVADHTQVSSPDSQKIYRQYGTNSYTDWMYQNNAWQAIATYSYPGVDDEPTAGSMNLISSNSVAKSLGYTKLRNGSCGNVGNPNAVTTEVLPTHGKPYIGIVINRPNVNGYKYTIYAIATDSADDLGKLVMNGQLVGPYREVAGRLNTYTLDLNLTSFPNIKGVMIQIDEVSVEDESVHNSLRIGDFGANDIIVTSNDSLFDYLNDKVNYYKNQIDSYASKALQTLSFTGNGDTFVVSSDRIKAINGHTYRFYLQQNPDMSGVTSTGKGLEIRINSAAKYYRYIGQELPAFVDITVDMSGENYLVIAGRCADGVVYTAYIQDLTNSLANTKALRIKNIKQIDNWVEGKLIQNDLTVVNSGVFKKTTPVQLLKGQEVFVTTGGTSGGEWKIFETDSSESYYIPIVGSKTTNTDGIVTISYKAIRDMYIVCQVSNTSELTYLIVGNAVVVSYFDSFNVIDANEPSKTLQRFLQYSRTAKGGSNSNARKNLVLAHFSDIHFDANNLSHIMQYCQYYKTYIDDILNTGDNVANSFNQTSESAYQSFISNNVAKDVLFCIGNHDTAKFESGAYDFDYYAGANAYARYMAPYIANWGVTHDGNTSHCYYYKDYTSEKVRLIVIDVMGWDSDELTWLQSTLASAITNDLQVVIAAHYPASMAALDCTFTSLFDSTFSGDIISSDALDAVDAFIGNGGVFVCWLTGHVHRDFFGSIVNHTNQTIIAISTASGNSDQSQFDNVQRVKDTKSYDLFNIVSIDTYNKRLSMFRVGADLDMYQRHIGAICYDYANKRLIYND